MPKCVWHKPTSCDTSQYVYEASERLTLATDAFLLRLPQNMAQPLSCAEADELEYLIQAHKQLLRLAEHEGDHNA
jgi:hypothetical protein